jgi:hypothetical protein
MCNIPPGSALWLSGGKDSRLLLEILTTFELEFACLRFDTGWSKEQRQVVDGLIKKHDLTVYSYPPAAVSLVGDGENLAWILDQAVGRQGEVLPVIRDIVPGTTCAYELEFPVKLKPVPPIYFTDHILGSKKGERHFALSDKDAIPGHRVEIGESTFHFPLYGWTDAEVLIALKEFFGVDYKPVDDALDTGNTACCTACMRGARVLCPKTGFEIDAVDWDPQGNLRSWQQAHGVEV